MAATPTRAAEAVWLRIPGMAQKPLVRRQAGPTAYLASQDETCQNLGQPDSGEYKKKVT